MQSILVEVQNTLGVSPRNLSSEIELSDRRLRGMLRVPRQEPKLLVQFRSKRRASANGELYMEQTTL